MDSQRRRYRRLIKRLRIRQCYNGEVAEFYCEALVEAELDNDIPRAERVRRRLDELDAESVRLEGAILRYQGRSA